MKFLSNEYWYFDGSYLALAVKIIMINYLTTKKHDLKYLPYVIAKEDFPTLLLLFSYSHPSSPQPS